MIKNRTNIHTYDLLDSWFYRSLPIKARLFVLSRLSSRYHSLPRLSMQESGEEMLVGYESSWPAAYNGRSKK